MTSNWRRPGVLASSRKHKEQVLEIFSPFSKVRLSYQVTSFVSSSLDFPTFYWFLSLSWCHTCVLASKLRRANVLASSRKHKGQALKTSSAFSKVRLSYQITCFVSSSLDFPTFYWFLSLSWCHTCVLASKLRRANVLASSRKHKGQALKTSSAFSKVRLSYQITCFVYSSSYFQHFFFYNSAFKLKLYLRPYVEMPPFFVYL